MLIARNSGMTFARKGVRKSIMADAYDSCVYRNDIYIDGYTYQISILRPSEELQPSDIVTHNHSRYELHALMGGSAVLELLDRPPILVKGGDCWIIAPHVYHLRRLDPGSNSYFVMFIGCPKGVTLQLDDIRCLQCAPVLIRLFCALEDELKNHRIGSDNVIQSLCSLLMVSILRELTMPAKQSMLPSKVITQQREDLMDHYFARDYAHEISAKDLAEKLGITTRQLARIMQQRYGCTFRQHLLEIRLNHARAYLTTTEIPAYRIATLCGFASQAAFTTAFHKRMGCSPSQYRKAKGGKK